MFLKKTTKGRIRKIQQLCHIPATNVIHEMIGNKTKNLINALNTQRGHLRVYSCFYTGVVFI